MAQSGVHAYISILLKNNKFFKKKWIFPSFLLGSIIPDIDYFFSKLHTIIFIPKPLELLNKTFAHSIFTIIFIYLLLLIFYEIKKNENYIHIANGMIFGMLFHLFIDIFLWYDRVDVFWPLPLDSIHIWKNIHIPHIIKIIILTFEFIFFRIFAYFSIQVILNHPGKNRFFIKQLSIWMKVELYFTIIFILSSYLVNYYFLYIIFFIGYIPSIIMMIYTIYMIWDSLDNYKKFIPDLIDDTINERSNLININ